MTREQDGEDRHNVTSGDEAMKCRHAAVTVRWSRQDGVSGCSLSPMFMPTEATEEEGVENQKSGNVAF